MYITMHCGGLPFNGSTISQRSLGGSESAAYYVAREMAKRGHKITLFTNHPEEGEWEGVRYAFAGPVTEQTPLGANYHFYRERTPADVEIVQRHPQGFASRSASKLRYLWLHDLALRRFRKSLGASLTNLNGLLTVSDWHTQQVCSVYGLAENVIHSIGNGVDLALIDSVDAIGASDVFPRAPGEFRLIYSSRPERGLEHLVRPGGIMEQLSNAGSKAVLHVCGYDNTTPQMAEFYSYLWRRCEELPNVVNHGPLLKRELYALMKTSDLHVYPSEFEETSCITAMEDAACGLPMLASNVGALPETTSGGGALLYELKDGKADEDLFVSEILSLESDENALYLLTSQQAQIAARHSWSNVADRLEHVIEDGLMTAGGTLGSKLNHLYRHSDYYAAKTMIEGGGNKIAGPLSETIIGKLERDYQFAEDGSIASHYASIYKAMIDEGDDPRKREDLSRSSRFVAVCMEIDKLELPAGAVVFDVGAQHGHYSINLAKRYPELKFIGLEWIDDSLQFAESWAEDEGIPNVAFYKVDVSKPDELKRFSSTSSARVVIAGEILEHVLGSPYEIVKNWSESLIPNGGRVILTTPYGPWEALPGRRWTWREHVREFERADLADLFGHFPGFRIVNVPVDGGYEPLGSYITAFDSDSKAWSGEAKTINYVRKLNTLVPQQTVGLAMIARDCMSTVIKTLQSTVPHVDAISIAWDELTSDGSVELVREWMKQYHPGIPYIEKTITSPTVTGFEAARNDSISGLDTDWILWLDSDEVLVATHGLRPWLRENVLDGYGIAQHHYSLDPPGVLKTDYPCRLFRTNRGIQFFGLVHEHPETAINKGPGPAAVLPDVKIAHHGYTDERTRVARFDRNLHLLAQDREKYPERKLGKFLWMRDLAQMNLQEVSANGGVITDEMRDRAREGIRMWRELMDDHETRMLRDGLEFYSTCVRTIGVGLDLSMHVAAAPRKLDGEPVLTGTFLNQEDANRFFAEVLSEQSAEHGAPYQ